MWRYFKRLPIGAYFLGCICLHTVLLIGMVIDDSVQQFDEQGKSDVIVYLLLFVPVRIILYVSIAVAAIHFENGFEIAMVSYVLSPLCSVEVFVEYALREYTCMDRSGGCLAFLVLIAIVQVLIFVVGTIAARDMGWKFFHVAGVNVQIRNLFKTWQRLQSMLKIDFVISETLALKSAFYAFRNENVLVAILAFLTAVMQAPMIYTVYSGIKYELYHPMCAYYVLAVAGLIMALVSIGVMLDISINHVQNVKEDRNTLHGINTQDVVIYSIALCLARTVSIFLAARLHRDFGMGLKEATETFTSDGAMTLRYVCCWQCWSGKDDDKDELHQAIIVGLQSVSGSPKGGNYDAKDRLASNVSAEDWAAIRSSNSRVSAPASRKHTANSSTATVMGSHSSHRSDGLSTLRSAGAGRGLPVIADRQ